MTKRRKEPHRAREKHFKWEIMQNFHRSQGHLCKRSLFPCFLAVSSLHRSLLCLKALALHPRSIHLPSPLSPCFSPLPRTKTVGRLTLITVRFFFSSTPHIHTHRHTHTGAGEVLCQHARPVQGTTVPFEVNRTPGNAETTKHSHT